MSSLETISRADFLISRFPVLPLDDLVTREHISRKEVGVARGHDVNSRAIELIFPASHPRPPILCSPGDSSRPVRTPPEVASCLRA